MSAKTAISAAPMPMDVDTVDTKEKSPPVSRRTSYYMTRSEYTRLIGGRMQELQDGATPCIPVDATLTDPMAIAVSELRQRKFPHWIRREFSDGHSEDWDPNTMILPNDIR